MLAPALSGTAAQDFRSGLSAYNSGDYAGAFHDWLGLAEQGDPAAEAGIGFLFHKGLGVTQDDCRGRILVREGGRTGAGRSAIAAGDAVLLRPRCAAKLRLGFRLVRYRRDQRSVRCVRMPRYRAGAPVTHGNAPIFQHRQRMVQATPTSGALSAMTEGGIAEGLNRANRIRARSRETGSPEV